MRVYFGFFYGQHLGYFHQTDSKRILNISLDLLDFL
uniref:Uncharacterized protein n=1 Tax=Rhizophora mucronata TaxID=61149 RepID=A0A2P2PXD4_RHIMU